MNPVEGLLSLLAPHVARELQEFFYAEPPSSATLVACAIAAGVHEEYMRLAQDDGDE